MTTPTIVLLAIIMVSFIVIAYAGLYARSTMLCLAGVIGTFLTAFVTFIHLTP